MRVTCCRNLRPRDLAEGMAVVVPVAENPSFYASGTVTKLTDRGGTRSFVVVPEVGPEIAASFMKKQISGDDPSNCIFVECDTDDPDGVPVRVAEVVGLRLRVAIDMMGPDPEAARVRVRAALEGAGLTWRQEGVEPYADIPAVTTPARSR